MQYLVVIQVRPLVAVQGEPPREYLISEHSNYGNAIYAAHELMGFDGDTLDKIHADVTKGASDAIKQWPRALARRHRNRRPA